MSNQTTYSAKMLLFGEYTIIQGAKALALPLPHFGGQWRTSKNERNLERQQGLWKLQAYLQQKSHQHYDLLAFKNALDQGDYFDSNIPQGYGAGSSGAVCAAVYDRFALHKIIPESTADLNLLKKQLADMESCFHGDSSGADPLVCYLNKGVLFYNKETIHLLTAEQSNLDGFFLIDTGISRQTGPLVNLYKDWCKEEIFPLRLEVELIPLVEDIIDAFLNNESTILMELIHEISYFQFKYFSEMIPAAFRTAWLDCLACKHTKLKLCGAGGGGFILGYSSDFGKTKHLLNEQKLIYLGIG